jgi:hypothetical protein
VKDEKICTLFYKIPMQCTLQKEFIETAS